MEHRNAVEKRLLAEITTMRIACYRRVPARVVRRPAGNRSVETPGAPSAWYRLLIAVSVMCLEQVPRSTCD